MKLLSLRDVYGETLVELGRSNPNIVVLDADLAFSTKTHLFKEFFPDRFFDLGLAEADMMSTAAGLASCGKIVFASTFAIFATGRAYEQIRLSINYSQLSVKIVATHAGLATGADGYSHQALEDIALMRVLPNMQVIAPCDTEQVSSIIKTIAQIDGPFYVRLPKISLPKIYEHFEFQPGCSVVLREGNDITIGAIGPMVAEALEAHNILKSKGISARIIDFVSVKPIDETAIKKACIETKAFITCEDHSVIGGLGDAVAKVILEYKPIPHFRVGVQDTFSESGDHTDLYNKYGLMANHIANYAIKLLDS
ncbi:MAG: transketolase family protein [Candidatus Stahlbacteria bacterium]|nr:transketolase family protein [Candidatus Stahlbacteria bacterium]